MVKRQRLSRGQESIQEGVLDYEFSLSPRAFYQLNPEQTEVLYSEAVKALDVSKEDHLIRCLLWSWNDWICLRKES